MKESKQKLSVASYGCMVNSWFNVGLNLDTMWDGGFGQFVFFCRER